VLNGGPERFIAGPVWNFGENLYPFHVGDDFPADRNQAIDTGLECVARLRRIFLIKVKTCDLPATTVSVGASCSVVVRERIAA
jgi:hypothetical protein